MILIVDYGMGNITSIYNMLNYLDIEVKISSNPDEISNCDKIILPGVGSFDSGMNKLRSKHFEEAVLEAVQVKKKPLLGICLGMQMLGIKSEEGVERGLGLIDFESKRFNFEDNVLKIPHMGWDVTKIADKDNPLVAQLDNENRYYFVHSYHTVCNDKENILMTCEYGYIFTAAVRLGNIYGVQFHPEKSHVYGMKILKNFAERV